MYTNFTIGNILSKAWKMFTKNWMVFLGLFFAYIILDWVLSSFFSIPIDFQFLIKNPDQALTALSEALSGGAYLISQLISLVLGGVFSLVFTRALIDAYDEKELIFYFNFKKFLYLILANILYSIIVGIGLILFIVPGIYLALRLQFYSFYIVDKDADSIEAITGSWKLTNGKTFNLFLLVLVSIGIVILGLLLLLIGVFPAIIICMIAQGAAYKILVEDDKTKEFEYYEYTDNTNDFGEN